MYQQVETDEEAVLDNGAKFEPVATLADEYGGRVQIDVDDGCYVVCVRQPDGRYVWSSHIFPEVFKVLRDLPPPNELLGYPRDCPRTSYDGMEPDLEPPTIG